MTLDRHSAFSIVGHLILALQVMLFSAGAACDRKAWAQQATPSTPPGIVAPDTQTLTLQNHLFGPRTEQFDDGTKVWTERFRRDGKDARTAQDELIFNFYGWKPTTDPRSIAQAFVTPRDTITILFKFQAPDEVTGRPAFFIVSETVYPGNGGEGPGEGEGYLNISKISSVGTGAYAVTFSRRFVGPDVKMQGEAFYLSPEGKAMAILIGHISVAPGWEQHFASLPTTQTRP